MLIVLAAWRLLPTRRWLPALLVSSLAVLALVAAGVQSMWYALVITILFAATMVVRRRWQKRAPAKRGMRPDAEQQTTLNERAS
ncbi:MAG TPA: hypothetical protein VFU63_11965 [Ktedonobacterales bacterium]|nr:hypothetical protein [Ktedonobacterales bacterium]